MTNVTVQLSDREIEALKARTGKRNAAAALKAWAACARAERSAAQLRAALRDSSREEAAGTGRRVERGREVPHGAHTQFWRRFGADTHTHRIQ
jgi:hypothetical protein